MRHAITAPVKTFWLGTLDPLRNFSDEVISGYGKKDAIRIFHHNHKGHKANEFYLNRLLLKPSANICPHLLQTSGLDLEIVEDHSVAHYDAYILEHQHHPMLKDHSISMYAQINQLDIVSQLVTPNWELYNQMETLS